MDDREAVSPVGYPRLMANRWNMVHVAIREGVPQDAQRVEVKAWG